MKIFMETLGCKVNTYESEVIKEEFLRNGYELADNLSDANVIVVNTCSVTNQSDAKSRKVIRNARKNNKNAILVVCGCSSQNHQDELKDLGADILIGNKDKSKICDYVNNYDNKQIINYYNMINTDFEKITPKFYENNKFENEYGIEYYDYLTLAEYFTFYPLEEYNKYISEILRGLDEK